MTGKRSLGAEKPSWEYGRNRPALMPPMRRAAQRLLLILVTLALVGCDHATKYAAQAELEGASPYELIGGVMDLRYAENTDIAFNLLRWIPLSIRAPLLLVLGAVAVTLLVLALMKSPAAPRIKFALALVTAGAIGNYADRVVRGYVVDFIHVQHWPVFNVADIYLTIGGILIGLALLNRDPPARLPAPSS